MLCGVALLFALPPAPEVPERWRKNDRNVRARRESLTRRLSDGEHWPQPSPTRLPAPPVASRCALRELVVRFSFRGLSLFETGKQMQTCLSSIADVSRIIAPFGLVLSRSLHCAKLFRRYSKLQKLPPADFFKGPKRHKRLEMAHLF